MTNVLTPTPKQKFFGNNGQPAVGYKLFTYEAGTSTKLATYPNNSVSVPNSNPIILDYRGEADIWIPPNVSYKYVLATPTDTDPPGSPLWTVDNLVNNQLLTLYGGVDTGIANAYVLTFDASFDSYADGIVIYFIAANANTGASTINVNGLGPVAITRQDGTALTSGQIVANQITQIMYKGTGFILLFSSAALAAITAPQNTSLVAGNYTLALTDQGSSIIMSVGSSRTLIIPPNSSVPFPLGTIIYVESEGSAALGIQRGSGVALYQQNGSTDANITIQAGFRSQVRLYKYSTDTWIASQQIISSGSFTGTLTGYAANPTGTVTYRIVGNVAYLYFAGGVGISGTSNDTTLTMTGLPAAVRPNRDVDTLTNCIDNSATTVCRMLINSGASTITFYVIPGTNFTGSGTKGLGSGWQAVYPL